MVIAPKWLKIRNSNLARVLPGTVPTECSDDKRSFLHSPRELIPTTFVKQPLASSSSPDNPINSSQGCVECCLYSAFVKNNMS